jgi:hypothetical protein
LLLLIEWTVPQPRTQFLPECDSVWYMADGAVAEMGPYAVLRSNGSRFDELMRSHGGRDEHDNDQSAGAARAAGAALGWRHIHQRMTARFQWGCWMGRVLLYRNKMPPSVGSLRLGSHLEGLNNPLLNA